MPTRYRHNNSYKRRIENKKYYEENKRSILYQQSEYRDENRSKILERKRQKYLLTRTSTRPYKQHSVKRQPKKWIEQLSPVQQEIEHKAQELIKSAVEDLNRLPYSRRKKLSIQLNRLLKGK